MTQAPTPGPLSAEGVKLLRKGDLLLALETTCNFFAGEVLTFEGPGPLSECMVNGMSWMASRFAFIGRPGADGWMPWSGGENPVPGRVVEIELRGLGLIGPDLSDHFDWRHEADNEDQDVIAFRLAPTAPVEASGSEREHGPKCWGKTSISDEMMYCYCGSTDSPPGETREALDRLKMAAHVYEDDEMAADCATLEALLSARPLALGGQKGDSETLRVLLDNLVIAQTLSKDIRQKATDEARSYLYDLRHTPQPSGKTREAVARLEDRLNARRMKARDEARNLVPQSKRATWVEDSLSSAAVEVPYADLLALLSACPLTLGGQS